MFTTDSISVGSYFPQAILVNSLLPSRTDHPFFSVIETKSLRHRVLVVHGDDLTGKTIGSCRSGWRRTSEMKRGKHAVTDTPDRYKVLTIRDCDPAVVKIEKRSLFALCRARRVLGTNTRFKGESLCSPDPNTV
jgi:hypothetical protein